MNYYNDDYDNYTGASKNRRKKPKNRSDGYVRKASEPWQKMIEKHAKSYMEKYPEQNYNPLDDFKNNTAQRTWFAYLYLHGTTDGVFNDYD